MKLTKEPVSIGRGRILGGFMNPNKCPFVDDFDVRCRYLLYDRNCEDMYLCARNDDAWCFAMIDYTYHGMAINIICDKEKA